MPRLATVEELIDYLDLSNHEEKVPGELLNTILEGAESLAESYAGRRFSPDPALVDGADSAPPIVKTIRARSSSVRLPDLRTATSVTLDGTTLTDGFGYDMDVVEGEPATRMKLTNWTNPWTALSGQTYRELVITGRWGFLECPASVRDAVLTLAARRWRERDAAFADTIQFADGGSLSYFRQLPASVKASLDVYRIPNIALVSA